MKILADIVLFALVLLGVPSIAFNVYQGVRWLRTPRIPLTRACPACGHRGCSLKTVISRTQANAVLDVRVQRTCNTCGAVAEEEPVLDKSKWLA